jgi:hypothetical protein
LDVLDQLNWVKSEGEKDRLTQSPFGRILC